MAIKFYKKFTHICEVCGRTEVLTAQEAHDAGWDYPPLMGTFGVVSPRTCPYCNIDETAWWQIMVMHKNPQDLDEHHKETLFRIFHEIDPGAYVEEENNDNSKEKTDSSDFRASRRAEDDSDACDPAELQAYEISKGDSA